MELYACNVSSLSGGSGGRSASRVGKHPEFAHGPGNIGDGAAIPPGPAALPIGCSKITITNVAMGQRRIDHDLAQRTGVAPFSVRAGSYRASACINVDHGL